MIAQMAQSALTVLVAGLCFGAGLPALFTTGIALWSRSAPEQGQEGTTPSGHLAARGAAVVCFAVVLAAVLLGVLWITRKSLDHYLGISVF